MPNMPYFGYQNPFNNYNQSPYNNNNLNQNSLTLEAYLQIEQRLDNIEKKLKDLDNRISNLETQKPKSFEYQTSMNMM